VSITKHEEITEPGPDPRSVIWHGGRTVVADLPADRIPAELADDPQLKAWWCLPRDRDALAATADFLGLDQFAVDDVIGPRETPKVDAIGDTVILVSAALSFDVPSAELAIQRVSILATDRVLVVVADEGPLQTLIPLLGQCEARMRADGIAAGVHIVLESLVDGYAAALEQMEEATDLLTSALFDDKPMGKAEQLRAFRMRQAIGHLRKVATPMTEVTAALASAAARSREEQVDDPVAKLLGNATARRFADVADHARHAAEGTSGLREMLNSAFETNLALSDVHLNMIMKKLSAWAAIIAVPTLITGFMGMNVPYPGFQEGSGFFVALAVMITAVVTLFVLFKHSNWL
jgi:magnesium transporter